MKTDSTNLLETQMNCKERSKKFEIAHDLTELRKALKQFFAPRLKTAEGKKGLSIKMLFG